jgi:phosphosulfolactate synthase
MTRHPLHLPERPDKPRTAGLTMMVDGGLPTAYFRDVVFSAPDYLDFMKFGWGTALVTRQLDEKIACLNEANVRYYFGGTLFEKYIYEDQFDAFRDLLHEWGCRYVEVSNGTIELSNTEKAGYIRKLADEFHVISEVGFKDGARSESFAPSRWIECAHEDLEAGAELVTLEARESGRSGICRPDGQLRYGLIEDLLDAGIDSDLYLFEAPTSELQTFMIKRLGPNVNLGNIPATSLVSLETLRLGLRADTLCQFDCA